VFAKLVFAVGLKLQFVGRNFDSHCIFMPGNGLGPHSYGQRNITAMTVSILRRQHFFTIENLATRGTDRHARKLNCKIPGNGVAADRLRATNDSRDAFRLRASVFRIERKRDPERMTRTQRPGRLQKQAATRNVDRPAFLGLLLTKRRGPPEPRRKLEPYTGMEPALHGTQAENLKNGQV